LQNGSQSRHAQTKGRDLVSFFGPDLSMKFRKYVSLVIWLVQAEVLFYALDQPTFGDFVQEMRVHFPSPQTLGNLVVPIYRAVLAFRESQLKSLQMISIAMDFAMLHGKKFLGLFYQGITHEFVLENMVLDLIYYPGHTFGHAVAAVVKSRIDSHTDKDTLLSQVCDCFAFVMCVDARTNPSIFL
jgi:hypothetical protein